MTSCMLPWVTKFLLKESSCEGKNSLVSPLALSPVGKGCKNENSRVACLESAHIHLKNSQNSM